MKTIITILAALLLMASCSKEKQCGSVYGSIDVYSDKYGYVNITGNDFNRWYYINKNAWVRVNLISGTYQMKRNETNEIDTFKVGACEIVSLIY